MNKHYLSDDIENLLYSNPDQALKIAQYLLSKTNTSGSQKARINFLVSKAYTVKGDYSSALNFLCEEKNYEDLLGQQERIAIEIDKTAILRELALDSQAKKTLENLAKKFEHSATGDLKSYLDASVAIEKAKFLLKEGNPAKGIALLEKQRAQISKLGNEFRELELDYTTVLGQLFLEQKNFHEAEKHFKSAIGIVNRENENDIFLKIDALHGLSRVHFLKEEYHEALALDAQALEYAKRLNNFFLQLCITQHQTLSYLAINDVANYKLANNAFFDLVSKTDNQEQDAINTAYNVISDEYSGHYLEYRSGYFRILYIVSALLLMAILVCVFFWQKAVQRKKDLHIITNYIEITRNNLMGSFSISDRKQEPRKNFILKETEEQILNKLKKFENSKRFLNKDISLAILAGQLDSNTKYLSEIINTHYNVNFNTYINKLRVNYIIEKLKTDPNFINYKISYLAEACGFSSHSSFATVFKSITGISPVKFIELLNQEKRNNLLEE